MSYKLALVLCLLASPLDAQVREIRIIHTNDIGGDLSDAGPSGGLGRIIHAVRLLQEDQPSLVLDAGNTLGPDVISSWDGGSSTTQAMKSVGYAASGVGNHDFDYGVDTLRARAKAAGFPFLAGNVKPAKRQDELPFEPYVITEINGVRIGVIGALDESIQSRMNPESAEALVVTNPAKSVQATLSALSSYGVDLTILLFHGNQKATLALAQSLPGLDLLVTGGLRNGSPEHTTTYYKLANGVHVATTPPGNGGVGYVDLSFVGDLGALSLTSVTSHLYDARHLAPDPVVSARVDSVEEAFAADKGRLLGKIDGVTIERRGSAVANLMRLHTESEIGIVSRRTFQEVEVDAEGFYQRDVDRLIRFDDVLVKLELQGKDLKNIASRSKRLKDNPDGLLFAGLDTKTMFVNGRPLRNNEPYRVVTLRRLVQGESGYSQIESSLSVHDTGISLRSLTAAGLEAWETLSSSSFWRLELKPIWRSAWSVEGSFNRNYVDETTAEYRAQGERVSFLRGETRSAWKTTTRYQLGHETSRSATTFESLADYGRVAGETTSDQFDADVTHRRRATKLKADPFVSAGFGTAFTKSDEGRPYQARASAGFQRRLSKGWVAQFAARGQRDFGEEQSDYGAEVTLNYRVRLRQGGRFRSRIETFFGLSDRKVISVENYNTLNFPLVGELSLTVRQNNFIYKADKIRGVPVTGVAFRTDLTVGLTYGIDWKWL
jgi:2',3'-cyclic-nucleotide 2'-phosphodiesterase (5'-nucleotidase family)